MLGEQNKDSFFSFLTKDMPLLKKGEKIRKLNYGYISFTNVDEEHCELIYPYGIKQKYRILDEYRHLYEISDSVMLENGDSVRTYIKK